MEISMKITKKKNKKQNPKNRSTIWPSDTTSEYLTKEL